MAERKTRRGKTRNRLEVDQRKEELLRLGRRLFGRYDYESLSISDIAEKAGVSKGLLYHYFPTKRDFYVETVRAAADELLRLTEGDPALSPLEQLRGALGAYLGYVEENSSAYISLLQSGIGVDAAVAKIVEEVRESVAARILESLGLNQPSATLRLALRGWIGFAEGASTEWLRTRATSREALQTMLEAQLIFTLSRANLAPSVAKGALRRIRHVFGSEVR